MESWDALSPDGQQQLHLDKRQVRALRYAECCIFGTLQLFAGKQGPFCVENNAKRVYSAAAVVLHYSINKRTIDKSHPTAVQ